MNGLLDAPSDDVQIWPSYTDVAMNLVLILLIYLFAQLVIATQTSASLVRVQQLQDALVSDLNSSLPAEMRGDVTATPDGNLLKVTFSDRVLFNPGQEILLAKGKELLAVVGRVLKRHTAGFAELHVEGHTDTTPINTPRFSSNWPLSSARATEVVQFLQSQSGMEPGLLTATGKSEYHPVDPRSTEEAKARNRRIEMVIVYSLEERVPVKP